MLACRRSMDEEYFVEYRIPNGGGWRRHYVQDKITDRQEAFEIWDGMRVLNEHLHWRVRHSKEEIPFRSYAKDLT